MDEETIGLSVIDQPEGTDVLEEAPKEKGKNVLALWQKMLATMQNLLPYRRVSEKRVSKHWGSKPRAKIAKKSVRHIRRGDGLTNHQRVVGGRAKRMGINVEEYQVFYPQMKTLTRKQLADCLSKIGSLIDSCIALNSKEGYRQARRLGDRYYNILTESRQHPPVSKIKGLSSSSTAIDEFETR